MELAQVTQQAAGFTILGSAFLLGIRHGIDWDHIAAITDIASTTTSAEIAEGSAPQSSNRGHRPLLGASFSHLEMRAVWLSLLYALGHASMVVLLGLGALFFAALLPDWLDPFMERVVGVTLLLLGMWVLYSLAQYARGKQDFRLQSRWMLVFAGVRHGFAHVSARLAGRERPGHVHVDQYGPRTAYGVGMIHGIGAETGSQILIIAAVGGAASQGLGLGMMLAFVVGLVVSNTVLAILVSTGFISSARAKPLYVALGAFTAVFSLVIGTLFTLGIGAELPDLNEIFGFIGPEDPE